VPESFRIARLLLDRIDNSKTGLVCDTFQVKIPEKRLKEVKDAAELLGSKVYDHFPFIPSATPMANMADRKAAAYELFLNKTWMANMAVTGAGGLPAIKDAGNVLRPETSLRISLRMPPTLDAEKAKKDLIQILTTDVPYGATVEILNCSAGPGLNCPEMTPAFEKTIANASKIFYGKVPIYYGEGGSIPFLSSLGKQYPKAQFLITGVLGPESNAHGANEMLEMAFTKKLICCLSVILDEFHLQ